MPELNDQSQGTVSAGVAERQAADAAIQAQDNAASGSRGDTHASQLNASRDVSFNPADQQQPASGVQQQQSAAAGTSGLATQPQQAAGEDGWQSALDYARSMGFTPDPRFQDDQSFLTHLMQQAEHNRQADYYAQLGQQIAPHYQRFQQYLGQNPTQPQQAQQQSRPEWEPPEFNEQWMQLVDRDPQSGVFFAKPGVNPQIAQQVNEYSRWVSKASTNPVATMRPYVEQQVPNLVRQEVAREIANYQRQQSVERIIQTNASWMYAAGPDGSPQRGYNGQPVATPAGARYAQHVQLLEGQGMRDPVAIDQLARQLLAGEVAIGHQRQQSQQNPNPVQQQHALASGRSQQNPLQSLPIQQRQLNPGATEPDTQGLSLVEMLRHNLDAAGFSDADFHNIEQMHS